MKISFRGLAWRSKNNNLQVIGTVNEYTSTRIGTKMKKAFILATLVILGGCTAQKAGTTSNSGRGDTRTVEVQLLDENTYLLTKTASDKSYGYNKANPVKVGGSKERSGPGNERRFLNALLGPNGESINYFREGSCCPFKTPNGFIDNMGMLDLYRLTWKGSTDTLDIYINMYDEGDLMVPVGLTAKKKN